MFHNHATGNKSSSGTSTSSSCVVNEDHEFMVPIKGVKLPEDMRLWEKSEAYFEYLGFILAVNEDVRGKTNSLGGVELSCVVKKVVCMLTKLEKMIDETPPIQQPQRFGNQAFRTWYQKLTDRANSLIQDILPEKLYRAIPEIMYYFTEGFGNSTRIDYGTGHEISFIMFLCCLFKIGALLDSDKAAVASKIFAKYLEVVRKLQQTYRMEPAGSHGVWSLDDYQFVPFIWGSSQLVAHPRIEPVSFLQQDIVDVYASDYLFLSCIKYINSVKTGPFAEHSNQLWGISGVANWSKINGGLIKMYKAEVLGKFPVVQHILFGSLLPLKLAKPNSSVRKMRMSLTPPPSMQSTAASKLSKVTDIHAMHDEIGEHESPSLKSKTGSEETNLGIHSLETLETIQPSVPDNTSL